MPRPPKNHQPQDMYWFAQGGVDSSNEPRPARESSVGPIETEDESIESCCKSSHSYDNYAPPEEPLRPAFDQHDSLSRSTSDKQHAVEERRKQILEAEQEKNEAILRRNAEREAALEARRNAQRSNMSYAFGTCIPPKNVEFDIAPVQLLSPSAIQNTFPTKPAKDLMSQSMTASMMSSTSRGRKKNDLVSVPSHGSRSKSGSTRKRSCSMSRLDILAQPRKAYVEAQKAGSTLSNTSSTSRKEVSHSPRRPLSSASEKSNKSGRGPSAAATVSRRPQPTVRHPRPISIAGVVPDAKTMPLRTASPLRKSLPQKKQENVAAKNVTSSKATNAEKPAVPPKSTKPKVPATPKTSDSKPTPKAATKLKTSTPKTSPARKSLTNKKQADMLNVAPLEVASSNSRESMHIC